MRVFRWTGLDNRTLTYDDFFCLWLNVEDAAGADNFHNTVSTTIAMGKGRIPHSWLTAAVQGTSDVQQWKNWDVLRLLGG